jgi:ferredoxin
MDFDFMNLTFDPSLIPYVELAEILNKIPNGFAYTEDGTHLKILKKIYTQEEANIACKLTLSGISVNEILGLDLEPSELTKKLETMHEKGQIRAWTRRDGLRKYGLMPWVVGIYEEQLDKMDEELAQLTEEYFEKSKAKGLFDTEPAIFKVLPINKEIKTELEIFPYENAELLIDNAKSWGIRDCICKAQQEHLGNTCSYPKTVCISFANRENAFSNNSISKPITKQEALNYLVESEEAGLVHCSMNVKEQLNYICNCCTCCCGILRGLTKLNQPYAFVKSNYVIHVEEEDCIGCETCIDRCQFDALSIHDEISTVNSDKCVGCGVCAITCTEEALHLIPRDSYQRTEPPENQRDWMTQKAINRGVDPSDIL